MQLELGDGGNRGKKIFRRPFSRNNKSLDQFPRGKKAFFEKKIIRPSLGKIFKRHCREKINPFAIFPPLPRSFIVDAVH